MKNRKIAHCFLFLTLLVLSPLLEGLGMGFSFAQQVTWQKYAYNNKKPYEASFAITTTKDSGIAIVRNISDSSNFTLSPAYLVLSKLNKFGNEQWSKNIGYFKTRTVNLQIRVIETDDKGFIVIGGFDCDVIKTDSFGVIQWAKTYAKFIQVGGGINGEYNQLTDVKQTTDGGLIVTGYTSTFGTRGYYGTVSGHISRDVYLLKLNKLGAVQWANTYGVEYEMDAATAVVQTKDGGYIISGSTSLPYTSIPEKAAFLLKVNSIGTFKWAKTYSTHDRTNHTNTYTGQGSVVTQFNSVIPTMDGGYLAVGEEKSGTEAYGYTGIWLVKTDSLGILKWSKSILPYQEYYIDNVYAPTLRGVKAYQLASDGYIIEGQAGINAGISQGFAFDQNSMLLKVDVAGNIKWFKSYGVTKESALNSTLNGSSAITAESCIAMCTSSLEGDYNDASKTYRTFHLYKLDSLGKDGECQNTLIGVSSNPTVVVNNYLVTSLFGSLELSRTMVSQTYSLTIIDVCINAPIHASFQTSENCLGDSTIFNNYSLGATYNWNFGDPNSLANNNSTARSPKHLFTSLGSYSVTLIATDGKGNVSDDTMIIVNILPKKFITLSGNVTICEGDSTLINAVGTFTLTGGYFSSWQPQDSSVSSPYNQSTFVSPKNTTTYKAYAYNGGCNDNDSLKVSVVSPIKPSINNNVTICVGTNTILSASGATNYLWSTGETSNTITINITANTSYTVSSYNGGCYSSVSVTVGVLPTIAISIGENSTITKGTIVTLKGSGGGSLIWSPSIGLDCGTCSNPKATPIVTTTYYLTIKATNNKCDRIDSLTVFVIDCDGEVEIPNAFSPNGDDKNDVLLVNTNDCFQSFNINIYNRWGEKVFESNNLNNYWDGTYKGKKLDNGVFVYFIEVITKSGDTISKKGNVSLIK